MRLGPPPGRKPSARLTPGSQAARSPGKHSQARHSPFPVFLLVPTVRTFPDIARVARPQKLFVQPTHKPSERNAREQSRCESAARNEYRVLHHRRPAVRAAPPWPFIRFRSARSLHGVRSLSASVALTRFPKCSPGSASRRRESSARSFVVIAFRFTCSIMRVTIAGSMIRVVLHPLGKNIRRSLLLGLMPFLRSLSR